MRTVSLGFCIVALGSIGQAAIPLNDNFNSPSLDTALWQTILPFGYSSVVQSGGLLTTTGRGVLATANSFATPYVISGSFTMLNDLEHFNIAFRTDLSTDGIDPYFERRGMFVSFSNDGNEVSIQRYNSSLDWNLLANTGFALNTGQAYTFSILDTGSLISLSVNGIDLLSTTNSYSTGDHIAFYSREFSSTATAIDSVTITTVPDSGATAIYLGMAMVGLAGVRRKRSRAR